MDEAMTDKAEDGGRMRRTRMPVCILSAILFSVTAAHAAETKAPKLVVPPDVFRDLPGVRPQGKEQFGSGYHCETVIRTVRSRGDVGFRGDGMPVRAYRCSRDGVVYESLRPPNPSGGWYPGVNPRIIDR